MGLCNGVGGLKEASTAGRGQPCLLLPSFVRRSAVLSGYESPQALRACDRASKGRLARIFIGIVRVENLAKKRLRSSKARHFKTRAHLCCCSAAAFLL